MVLSAPESALASAGGRLPGRPFAEYDPALAQIVRRHFDMYAVAYDRSDTVSAHLACRIADDAVLIIEGDAEPAVGQDLVDLALHQNELFLRQIESYAYKKNSRGFIPQRSQRSV